MKRTKLTGTLYRDILELEQAAHRYRSLLPVANTLPELPLPENTCIFRATGVTWRAGYASIPGAVLLTDMKKCLKTMYKSRWMYKVESYHLDTSYNSSGPDFISFTYRFTPSKGSQIARELSYTSYNCIFIVFSVLLDKKAESLVKSISNGKCKIVRGTTTIAPIEASEIKSTKLVCEL